MKLTLFTTFSLYFCNNYRLWQLMYCDWSGYHRRPPGCVFSLLDLQTTSDFSSFFSRILFLFLWYWNKWCKLWPKVWCALSFMWYVSQRANLSSDGFQFKNHRYELFLSRLGCIFSIHLYLRSYSVMVPRSTVTASPAMLILPSFNSNFSSPPRLEHWWATQKTIWVPVLAD